MPPLTVVSVADIDIVDVPALNVRFVFVVNVIGLPPLNVTVELPRLIVRVLVLLDDRLDAVTFLLLVLKVPEVTVTTFDVVKSSCNVQVAVERALLPIVIELTVVRFLPPDVMVYEPDVA